MDFMVNYVSGTLWCSRIWNMRPESPRTVFNFKLKSTFLTFNGFNYHVPYATLSIFYYY